MQLSKGANPMILFFTACSILLTGQCEVKQIPLRPEITAQQCFMFGQFGVSEWARDHPNYVYPSGYKCKSANKDMVKI